MRSSVGATCVSLLVLASGAAFGQDVSRSPSFGSTSLEAGFTPDPYVRSLTAGGSIPASSRFTNCTGYIAEAPDFSLHYSSGVLPLIFSVDADRDTTLVINDPGGGWWCDDDGARAGLNPMVRFDSPRSGRYDVWVGTFGNSAGVPATLFISETGDHTRASAGTGGRITANTGNDGRITANTGNARLAIGETATHGTFNLAGSFLPDPATRPVTAGGPVSIPDALSGVNGCRGMTTSAPTVELLYSGSGTVHIYTEGSADTTLAVNAPNGTWYCNDDGPGIGTDAGLSLSGPGTYDIYVGTYSGNLEQTRLMISEISIGYTSGRK